MKILHKNLFDNLPKAQKDELFEEILSTENIRVERIISDGQKSPAGFWYDQEENEFVVLMQGSAVIEFEDGETVNLKAGDYLYLPAKMKHRINYTDEKIKTVWLALFFNN
jgi:cupin 2 domain-containing protein